MFNVKAKNQRGFTLIELLAVMAIVAVLAGIVAVAVGGTGETSKDTQAKQDATTVETAASDFFADQEGAEVLTPLSATVLLQGPFKQIKSSRWPEEYISVAYNNVFPETTTSTVSSVTFLSETGTVSSLTFEELLTNYNAIDIDRLFDSGFLSTIPNSGAQLTDDTYSNYLWLLQKTTASGGSSKGAARQIAVFKLVSIEKNEANNLVDLTYLQLIGESAEESAAVNNAPVADQNIVVTTLKNGARIITLLAIDADGDDLTFDVLTGVSDGPFQGTLNTSLLTATPPRVTYTPAFDFVGSDFFKFTVSDGDLTDQATVFVSIEEPQALAVAPGALNFGTAETSKPFVIINTGGSILSWSITDDQTWIGTTPTFGSTSTEADTITVTVDRTGLAVGNYNGTITVTSNDGTKPVLVDMEVPAPLVIDTTTLPGGTVESPYAGATLQASGGTGNLAWSIKSGTLLPVGLTLNSAGLISGTPAVGTTGTNTFTVQVTDSAPSPVTTEKVLSITVAAAPLVINTTTLPGGTVNSPYVGFTLQASGGTGTLAWVTTLGSLPAGLNLTTAGLISGAPAVGTAAIHTFTVEVTDSAGVKNTRVLSITVVPAPLIINTNTLPGGTVNSPYAGAALQASGGTGTLAWAIALGSLPTGLNLTTAGLISGTPAVGTAVIHTFTVEVTDSAGVKNTRALSITVVPAPLIINTNTLPGGTVNSPYAGAALQASGGTGTLAWAITLGSLPTGLNLTTAGLISGTPAVGTAGIHTFTVEVTDSAGVKNTQVLILSITVTP